MKKISKRLIISSCLILVFSQSIIAKTIKIATLEWPPYTCEKCEGGGITTKILRQHFKKHGIEATFTFFPWARASKLVVNGSFDALWPCWPKEVEELKLFQSKQIFSSPMSFVGHKDNVNKVKKLQDLENYNLGSVVGYGYNNDFKIVFKNSKKGVQEVLNDQMNIEKLIARRVDFIAIDLINLRYLLHTALPQEINNYQPIQFAIYEMPLVFGIHQKDKYNFDKIFSEKKFRKSMNKKIEEELKNIFITPPKKSENENLILRNYLTLRDDVLTREGRTR